MISKFGAVWAYPMHDVQFVQCTSFSAYQRVDPCPYILRIQRWTPFPTLVARTNILFILWSCTEKIAKTPCALSSAVTVACGSGVKAPSTVQSCVSCSSAASCAMISCRRHSLRGLRCGAWRLDRGLDLSRLLSSEKWRSKNGQPVKR